MGWQIVIICMLVCNVCLYVFKDGEDKGIYIAWEGILANLITAYLLYKAGCFDLI